ncbi:MAG: ATP-binding protein [Candidatus Eisenbacteria bacterium]
MSSRGRPLQFPKSIRAAAIAGLTSLTLVPMLPHSTPASEMSYAVRAWTLAEGLPASTVQDIAQTPDGYLWLATTGGLARFDGVRFEVFGLEHGLSTNRFQGLTVGRDGSLWISAEDGALLRWDGQRFEHHESGSPRGAPALVTLPDGRILGAGFRHYALYGATPVHLLQEPPDLTTPPIVDAQGVAWLTAFGAAPARREGDRVLAIGPGGALGDHWILDHRTRTARFFRRQGDDAELLDTNLQRIAALPGGGHEDAQLIDRNGRLWALAGEGVVVRDGDSGRRIGSIALGLSSAIGRLFLDRQDNIWVGSQLQGLIRIARSPVTLLRPPGVTGPVPFLRALESRRDGVVVWDGVDRIWFSRGDQLEQSTVSIVEATFFGTDRLSFRMTNQQIELRDERGGGGVIPTFKTWPPNIIEDPRHPLSAVVNDDEGLRYISALRGQSAERRLLPMSPLSRDVFFDHAGVLWVTTVSGLWRFSPSDSLHFTRRDGLPADHLRQVHEDRDGTLWIGTYGAGLVRYHDGKFATLDRRHGLLEDVVSAVLEDDDGDLWLGGNAGIQRISRSEANECLDGRRSRIVAVGYGRDAGLRNPEGSGFPGMRSRDGRLWFGTFDGMAVVDPRVAHALVGTPPPALIEAVFVGDSTVPRTARGFTLAPDQRRFRVRFTGIDLRAPEQLRFRYRLDGVDRDWIDAGDARVASYTFVPAGRHRFWVSATDASGKASPVPAQVVLEVRPYAWETWPLQLLGFVLLVTGIVQLWRWRSRQLIANAGALQRAVDERTAEVVEAKARIETALTTVEAQAQRLEALDRARSRFFASVSHEFRTPLTLIQGPLQDVSAGEHGALRDDAREQVRIALDSATRLQRLVDQLLDAARAEAGELRLERVPGDLLVFLTELAQAFAPLAVRKRITFAREFVAGPCVASFDALALEKVFANLLGNAFKFTPEGGHVTWTARRVAEGSATGALEIAIIDNGPGIAAEDLPHIFKRFYRSERSVTRMQPGTGLGLALAHDMVEQHDGSLHARSQEGHGATFTVRLPLLEPSASEPYGELAAPNAETIAALADEIRLVPGEVEARAVAEAPDAPLILVVEDHPDVRAYVARQLRRRYRVIEAADGEQALAQMRAAVPDLVVTDLAMPVMDGLSLCRAVRNDPELEFVPLILLAAAAETETRVTGIEAGADDYVTKPFEVRELLARIARMLHARHRLREHLAREAATAAVYGAPAPAHTLPPAADAAIAASPEALAVPAPNPIATAFLRRMREVLAARLGDEGFGVEELGESMGLGRTLLYQRTRELLDLTPMELLTNHRLERAAELLEAGQGGVGEVAYAVGFRSVSHFTNRFRERFAVTPSGWKRGERAATNQSEATT